MTDKHADQTADQVAEAIGNKHGFIEGGALAQHIGNPVATAPNKGKATRKRNASGGGKRKTAAKGQQQANSGQKAKAATKGKASGTAKAKAKAQQASGKAEGQTAKGSIPANQIADNAVIRVLVETNPKKQGTWAERMFAELMQCDGQTVADYADRLANVENLPKGYRAKPELQLALRKEWVRLEQPK